MLIGIHGPARTGKDTVFLYLSDMLREATQVNIVKVAFADPLKDICRNIFGFREDQLHGGAKDVPDPRYTRPDGSHLTPRWAMQQLGTEWGRSCDPNLWVRVLNDAAERIEVLNSIVVIPDVRFANEAQYIRERGQQKWSRGTFLIKIDRPGAPRIEGTHASEQGLPDEMFDAVLRASWERPDATGRYPALHADVSRIFPDVKKIWSLKR